MLSRPNSPSDGSQTSLLPRWCLCTTVFRHALGRSDRARATPPWFPLTFIERLPWETCGRTCLPSTYVEARAICPLLQETPACTARSTGIGIARSTDDCLNDQQPPSAPCRRFTVQNMVATFEVDAPVSLELMAYNRARWVGWVGPRVGADRTSCT